MKDDIERGDDPFVESIIDEALARYEHVVSEPHLAAARQTLRDMLANDPLGMRLLARARPKLRVIH